MKNVGIVTSLSILAMLAIVGCGGGGSGGAEPTATLTDANIKNLGESTAKALPGCAYADDTDVVFSDIDPKLLNAVLHHVRAKKTLSPLPLKERRSIDDTEDGDCGGHLHIYGTHDNGDDDLTYTYTNYCVGEAAGTHTLFNGSTHVVKDGTPTASGPVIESVSVSTSGTGLSAQTTENGETKNATLTITNLEWKKSGTITADKLKSVSPDGTYELSNLSAEFDSDTSGLRINSATYNDPKVGLVTVSTNMMSESSPGKITVIGAEGKAVFEEATAGTKKFLVKNENGDSIGAVDCSEVDIPTE